MERSPPAENKSRGPEQHSQPTHTLGKRETRAQRLAPYVYEVSLVQVQVVRKLVDWTKSRHNFLCHATYRSGCIKVVRSSGGFIYC